METKKSTSETKTTYKNPSPLKTNAKQAKGQGFKGKMAEAVESSESTHGPKNKMSLGMTTTMHGKAIGGHPEHRASEFDGMGKGYATKMGKDCR